VEAIPLGAPKKSSWDKTHHRLVLDFSFSGEAVLVKVDFSK